MKNIFISIAIIASLLILSGCSQKHIDAVSDITYILTGVPGPKHKNQGSVGSNTQTKVMLEKEREANEFKNRRLAWVGKSIDDLIMQRGSPWGVHKRTDGGSQYTFKKTQNSSNDPYLNNPRLCVDNFITDKKGIIKDWSSSNCLY
ncbi:hypothetical protein [Acinetobacter rudis]|uniref:Lipoprotein n=1 Tax=Acinetobacter rudis CIP 110305 TaxID=421052 RepID=S3N3N7_9GAMM|nr:hypothetical protein [Acinetobacter rudis]EPF74615.1 hypothetical protein F945_01382 [Acinetobacter rudis CIP 110305]